MNSCAHMVLMVTCVASLHGTLCPAYCEEPLCDRRASLVDPQRDTRTGDGVASSIVSLELMAGQIDFVDLGRIAPSLDALIQLRIIGRVDNLTVKEAETLKALGSLADFRCFGCGTITRGFAREMRDTGVRVFVFEHCIIDGDAIDLLTSRGADVYTYSCVSDRDGVIDDRVILFRRGKDGEVRSGTSALPQWGKSFAP
jgi:hypothetical protein